MHVTSTAALSSLLLALAAACGEPAPVGNETTGTSDGSGSTSTTSSSTALTDASATTSPTTTATTTTTVDTSGAEATTSTESDTRDGFELDCHTELVKGVLAFGCNLPRMLAACAEIEGAPCDDVDGDGLTDAWEDLALDRLRPLRRLDEGEMLLDDPAVILGDVGRVFAVADHIRVFMMLGYSLDYGSCGGISGHNGDSEHVALDLVDWPDGGAGGVMVTAAYTAAHEGTATDASRLFGTDELNLLVFDADPTYGEPRWIVFPSRNKHGTYASIDICENISMVPCLDEDCGPDGVEDPAAFDVLPAFVNAGEPESPRVTALDELGFVGDDAWADQDFCGGQERTGCTAPVHEKLTIDPF